jgi:hypothetical protein
MTPEGERAGRGAASGTSLKPGLCARPVSVDNHGSVLGSSRVTWVFLWRRQPEASAIVEMIQLDWFALTVVQPTYSNAWWRPTEFQSDSQVLLGLQQFHREPASACDDFGEVNSGAKASHSDLSNTDRVREYYVFQCLPTDTV